MSKELIVGYGRFDAYEKEPGTDIVKSGSHQISTERSTTVASGEVLSADRTASFKDSSQQESVPLTRDIIKKIAMDIGKEVVHHIKTMYPTAYAAAPSTFKISVRNCIHNEIMAALEVTDEGKILARLDKRKKFRRWQNRMRKVKTMEEFGRVKKDCPI